MSEQQTNLISQLAANFTVDFTYESFINNFHFIRPLWLLAFIALFLLLFILKKIRYYQSPWQHFLPAHLASALLENSNDKSQNDSHAASSQNRYWLKPLIIGSCIIVSLAGPAWQKLPQPVYQLERGAVLIMDMSYSMYATDLTPNRLTRARYKAIDLLNEINEGDVGLIAYAGDAFIISPLTQDVKNIELLLPSLSPDIMPVHGANALAALILADNTLKNAGHISGDIYWFTDDIENDEMSDIYSWANDNNHKVNILGVGSEVGAPIKLSSGKLLKDNSGAIVIPKLPEGRLSSISKRSRGVYRTMTNDDTDIKALTAHLASNLDDSLDLDSDSSQSTQEKEGKQLLQGDQYQEQGPWLLLIILPLILSYFRRGTSILSIAWLMPLTFMLSLVSLSPVSYAQDSQATSTDTAPEKSAQNNSSNETSRASQIWQDLWKTSDQQAQQHYQKEEYQQAANQFENSQWQGSAHYKAGEYQQALDAFKQNDSAQSLYNQGNALAHLQQLDEAISAYKEALAKDPNLTDAQDNLDQLEALKKQQEQSQQSQDGENKPQDQQGEQQKQDSQQESQDQSQGDNQEGEQDQGKQQQGEQQESDETQQQKDGEQQQESEQQQEQQRQEEKARQAEESKEEQQSEDEQTLAQQANDSKAQETQQKHQQLLNKVTDDPYLLLRNKMRLEYQKRRQEGASKGETKKW